MCILRMLKSLRKSQTSYYFIIHCQEGKAQDSSACSEVTEEAVSGSFRFRPLFPPGMGVLALAFVQDIAYRLPLVRSVVWKVALLAPLRRDREQQVSVQDLLARIHYPEADFSGNSASAGQTRQTPQGTCTRSPAG